MMDKILQLADAHGAHHEGWMFNHTELARFYRAAAQAGADAKRDEVIKLLLRLHDAAAGRHSYYLHAVMMLKEEVK